MNEPTNDRCVDQGVSNSFVFTDSDIAKSERLRKAVAKLVMKERSAMFAKSKAIDAKTSVSEEPALELWEEMPEVAKEFEAFDAEEDVV